MTGYVGPAGLLTPQKKKMMSAFNKKYNNTPVRMGCVVEVLDVDSKNNNSDGNFIQYNVITDQKNSIGKNYSNYNNCIAIDSLGGVGDFFEYKLRASDSEKYKASHDFKKQNGSMVLILCLDGFSESAIIIGGVKHPDRESTLTENGLHLEGEYNGINWQINDDGELTITLKTATDNDGIPVDEVAGGSHIKMDKEGSIDLNANLDEAEETYIRMDKKNKDVGLKAGQHIGLTAKGNVGFNADGKISGKAKGAVEFIADGSAKISAKSSIQLEGGSAAQIKGGNVVIEGGNGVIVKGNQTVIDSQSIQLGNGGLGAVIQTTKFIGTGNLGGPVVCNALGPFSKTVFVAP